MGKLIQSTLAVLLLVAGQGKHEREGKVCHSHSRGIAAILKKRLERMAR